MAIYQHFDTGEIFTTADLLKLYNDFNTEPYDTFDDFLYEMLDRGTEKTGGLILLEDLGVEDLMLSGLYDKAYAAMVEDIRDSIYDLYDGDDKGIFLEIYTDYHAFYMGELFTLHFQEVNR